MYFNRSLVLFCGLFASLVFSSGIVFSSFPQVCHSASVALTFALRRALGDTHKPGAILPSLKPFSLERFLLLRQIVVRAKMSMLILMDGTVLPGYCPEIRQLYTDVEKIYPRKEYPNKGDRPGCP